MAQPVHETPGSGSSLNNWCDSDPAYAPIIQEIEFFFQDIDFLIRATSGSIFFVSVKIQQVYSLLLIKMHVSVKKKNVDQNNAAEPVRRLMRSFLREGRLTG